MREKADAIGVDLLLVDTGDRIEGNGLYDASDPKGKYTYDIFREQDIDVITPGNHELYQLDAADREYEESVPNFKGKYLLVVNLARKSSYNAQLAALEKDYETYKDKGVVVIGVPSNDFGAQEPGTSDQIASFCELNYGVDFPMMGKVHVKGGEAHPFFKWAAKEGGLLAGPKWNFFKYLVGSDGQLVDWFSSFTKPDSEKFKSAVEKMLAQ